MSHKLAVSRRNLTDPLVRIEAKATTDPNDIVATIRFLGRFDPEAPSPDDHADPELIEALEKALAVAQAALKMLKSRFVDAEVERAREQRRVLGIYAGTSVKDKETEH